ncbi:MAG: phosphoserine phosphatase SerB [Proteobacteria bacterium]|nr:phosphoserine phosphatase SerB [Pseudomonadota bacterium]
MSASGGRPAGSGDRSVTIARVIADEHRLAASLPLLTGAVPGLEVRLAACGMAELASEAAPDAVRAALDAHLMPADLLVADHPPRVPQLFVSDMDSTMIGQECIDELADFAGLKAEIAAITERAMQGELDFEAALRERVALLAGLPEAAIQQCLAERITAMPGARVLVQTLKAHGCRAVLVTGGFHQFADPVAAMLGFDAVVANRLEIAGGKLTGGLVGPVCHAGTKLAALQEGARALGAGAVTLAAGDGANDVPMLQGATYGVAYHAKPRARAAANGAIDAGDLTSLLRLLGVPAGDWRG